MLPMNPRDAGTGAAPRPCRQMMQETQAGGRVEQLEVTLRVVATAAQGSLAVPQPQPGHPVVPPEPRPRLWRPGLVWC